MMLITLTYDTENPQAKHNIMSLLLLLDGEVEVALPQSAGTCVGILREVVALTNRLIELYIEIDDIYESLYFVSHYQGDMSLIHRN